MLINSDEILRIIMQTRQAWIFGYTGCHKTSLAYRFAYELIKKKVVKYLYTNNRSIWADDITKAFDQINGVVIIDEGGIYIESKKEVTNFKALAMKLNVIYLIPSNEEPPKNFQVLKIEPIGSIIDSGIPLIVYRWETKKGGQKDNGFFGWWDPSEIYGVYSRQDPGENTTKLLEEVKRITGNFYAKFGRENTVKKVDFTWWEVADTIEKIMEEKQKE